MERVTHPIFPNHLIEKVKNLSESPGCYLWKNSKNEVIYVGKALKLSNRVKNYLSPRPRDMKLRFLQKEIFDLEWILTRTEKEALILEATLIKKYNPKYNVRLKDDKGYPYICVSIDEPYPMLYLSRNTKNQKNQKIKKSKIQKFKKSKNQKIKNSKNQKTKVHRCECRTNQFS